MTETPTNPFEPMVRWREAKVTIGEDDDKKTESAKHYYVRYIVGETEDKRYVDGGKDNVEPVSEKSLSAVTSIHKVGDDAFHYNRMAVECISANGESADNIQRLNRVDQCGDHELVEIVYQSPGVDCCAQSKEEADKLTVPLQYIAGYLLGKSDDMVKIALAKTETESGKTYYDSIRIIPDGVVEVMNCLE